MSYNEKATVSVDTEGNVLKCAKGANALECGFVKGAEICAKCGALPVEMKMVPVSEQEEKGMYGAMVEMPKKKKNKKRMGAPMMAEVEDDEEMMEEDAEEKAVMVDSEDEEEVMEEDEDDDVEMPAKMYGMMPKKMKKKADDEDGEEDEEEGMLEDEEEMEDEEEAAAEMTEGEEEEEVKYAKKSRRTTGKKADMMADEDEEDSEEEMPEGEMSEDEEKMYRVMRKKKKAMRGDMAIDEEEDLPEDTMEDEEDDEDEEEGMAEKSFSPIDSYWEEVRRSRINSLGVKSADIGAYGYLCALERKAYPGSSSVCDDCPGGCVAEKGLPGILHAEGIAEQMFDGVVVDSGYSPDADMFVVDVQAKDGSVKEVFVDGTSAEIMGFHKLDISDFEQKSDYAEYKLIDFTEAAEIAVKSIDGQVVAVEPDVFEGFDTYAVEVEGFDGKSYDVFVSLDGEVLGYDRYEQDEAQDIEAEAAEIAIKRAFSEEKRMELAKGGMALPDGSYPIVTEADLRNAIQAFGRAKDKEAAKKHIMKRARALKLESLIPANWIAGTSEKSEKEVDDASFMASLVEFQLLEDQIDNDL
jgi:hypothetical protein